MAAAEAGVCNMALLRIGQAQTIDNLNEASVAARACKAFFATARDAVLEARPWPFASHRATLAQLATLTTTQLGQWGYGYSMPADCLAPRYLFSGTDEPAGDADVPFATEDDPATGKILLTNLKSAVLVYTAQILAPPKWSAMFTDALAYKLASDLALGLAKKPDLADSMLKKYLIAVGLAAAAAKQQTRETSPQPESQYVRGR